MNRESSEGLSQNPAARERGTRVDLAHPGAEPSRMSELDGLRGLAALAVVVFHWKTRWLPVGWAAVDLFFVLSGYLITGIVLRHGGTPGFLTRFYIRRGLRVWPIYYLVLGLFVVATPWLPRQNRWEGLPQALTFTQGIQLYWAPVAPMFCGYLGHAWTLAIEEQFYVLWPALVLLSGRRHTAALALAFLVGSFTLRCLGFNIALLGSRGEGLALGGLLAVLLAEDPSASPPDRSSLASRFRTIALVSMAGVVVVRLLSGPPTLTRGLAWPGPTILAWNLVWFGVVGWVVCQRGAPRMAWLRSRRLVGLGQISYGLYLYHFPILVLSSDIARRVGYTGKVLWREIPTLALCFLVAWLSWVFIEQPILALKDRLGYRPRPVPPPHAPREAATVEVAP